MDTTQARYRMLAENALDVVYQTDVSACCLWISPSVEAVLGWRPDDLVGRKMTKIVHPDDLAQADARRRQGLAEGATSGRVELRFLCKDGTWRWMDAASRPVLGPQGCIGGLTALRDIHDRVLSRQALAASEARYRGLAESIRDIVATFDSAGQWTWISPSVRAVLGWDPAELLAHSPDLLHEADVPEAERVVRRLVAQGDGAGEMHRVRLRHRDGSYRWFEINVGVGVDADGNHTGTWTLSRDVDAQVRAEAALQESRQRYQLLAEQAADVVLLLDDEGRLEWVSPAVTRLLAWSPDDLIGQRVATLTHIDDLALLDAARRDAEVVGEFRTLARLRRGDGTGHTWVRAVGRALRGQDGRVRQLVVNWHDATGDVAAQAALRAREERFRLAIAQAPLATLLVDLDGRISEANDAAAAMLGIGSGELVGVDLRDLVPLGELPARGGDGGLDRLGDSADDEGLIRAAESVGAREVSFRTRSGAVVWGQVNASVVRDGRGRSTHLFIQILDMTRAHKMRDKLAHRALHDPLTGLGNRRLFETRLKLARSRAERHRGVVALLFCDLDQFKSVNDQLGHDAGDAVLRAVATRLAGCVREGDLVARLGGDEFVVLAEDLTGPEEAVGVAQRIVASVAEPVPFRAGSIATRISVGISCAWGRFDGSALVRRADEALYRAKASGRGGWALGRHESAGAPRLTSGSLPAGSGSPTAAFGRPADIPALNEPRTHLEPVGVSRVPGTQPRVRRGEAVRGQEEERAEPARVLGAVPSLVVEKVRQGGQVLRGRPEQHDVTNGDGTGAGSGKGRGVRMSDEDSVGSAQDGDGVPSRQK